MADNGAVPEQKEKLPIDDPEAAYAENELDDSKAKFINGGNSLEDTKVIIPSSGSVSSFSGLGKDELKKYAEDPFWVRLRWILFILFWVGWLAMLVSAIVIIVLAPRCPSRPDLKWYHKDVAYNVYAKSFLDEDKPQDGLGDMAGIKKKEGYVTGLGANTFWLSSVLKTEPGNDRAVIDYRMLDEKFGTVEALRAFCKKLMKESKRVILDLIPNQTSKNHTWFMKSQKKEDKYANYYIWADKANNWVRADGTSMWVMDSVRNQYYLSQFDGLPDLNLTNEDVIAEFKDVIGFWASIGVSGFHINDLEYLTENSSLADDDAEFSQTRNFADNAEAVDSLRAIVDGMDNKPGREKLLFGTVTEATMDQVDMYYGLEGKRGLHLVSVVLKDLTETVTAQDLETQLTPYINMSSSHWMGWRLTTSQPGSHRAFARVGKDRMIIAQALMALLPGSALPYYGDEIGMVDGVDAKKRTVTPMQWTKGDNAGFTSETPWLAVNTGYDTTNVDSATAQLGDNVMMNSFQALNKLRSEESLQFGKTRFCTSGQLLIFARHAPGFESFVVVANLGSQTAHKFQGDECVGDRETATLVFHSHKEHEDTALKLNKAVEVGGNEVLVFKFPA